MSLLKMLNREGFHTWCKILKHQNSFHIFHPNAAPLCSGSFQKHFGLCSNPIYDPFFPSKCVGYQICPTFFQCFQRHSNALPRDAINEDMIHSDNEIYSHSVDSAEIQDDTQFEGIPQALPPELTSDLSGENLSASMPEKKETKQLQVSPEAKEIFDTIWEDIEKRLGTNNVHIPKEILWLNGAPGSGKGANTPFILKTRGFEAKAIQVSDLLQSSPETFEIMRHGGLVRDSLVLELLLESILSLNEPMKNANCDTQTTESDEENGSVAGVVVDGFPRTTIQVDFVKLLYDKLMELHYRYLNSPLEDLYPRPIFRIAILYVEEEESVRRQLARGKAAMIHNQRVRDSGVGELKEVRTTDLCEKSARKRYQVFREHYDTLLRLKSFFPFHLIDGMGTLSECRDQIEKELQYQSALELDASTFKSIAHIPLAKDIVRHARRNMVARLDNYAKHQSETFNQIVAIIDQDIVPLLRTCALSGMAVYNTESSFLINSPNACQMLADILSERGFYVNWQSRTREIPVSIDPKTFVINSKKQTTLLFRIKFDRPMIRSLDSSVAAAPSLPSNHSLFSSPLDSRDVSDSGKAAPQLSCVKLGTSQGCDCE